ncbi:MAG: serine/threonine protein kinase [Myxococcales bacterium]|nr:serine/threonine protein kinase [Myxococcales bacterium]
MEVDRYEILRQLGRGNVGNVYLARHRMTGREVALKVSDPRGDRELAARILNEARIAATVQHPSLVDIYDCGALDDGRVFVAMQHVVGETLEAVLDAEGSKLSPDRAVGLALQVLDALDALHARGIVHRDIKPANLLVRREGDAERVFVIDFGISKLLPPSPITTNPPTITGTILGTPGYMPPEQLDARTVDARADLFSVGAVLFRAIAGRTLFDADSLGDWFIALSQQQVPSLASAAPSAPSALCAVVDRALSLDRERRPSSAREMHAWLVTAMAATETVAAHREPSSRGEVPAPEVHKPASKPRWFLRLGACLALLGLGFGAALAARRLAVRETPAPSASAAAVAPSEPDPLQSALSSFAQRALTTSEQDASPTSAPTAASASSASRAPIARASEPSSLIESQSGAVLLRAARPSASVDMGEFLEWVHAALPELERCHPPTGAASARFSIAIQRRGRVTLDDAARSNDLTRCAFRALQTRADVVAMRSTGAVRDLQFSWP